MSCGCGSGSGSCAPRQYLTKEEKLGMLKEYKQELEQELQGIKEKMEELSK
ncbi:MAG: DUF5320 domain-containing protein [Nanoarchaeota archaeon]|nr:DUF5320 domain-containing protein [Nanoarchaeota archaeon]